MQGACAALGLNRATAYRLQGPKPSIEQGRRKARTKRIPDFQRTEVLALLDSERFVDQPPREAYAALRSEGTYHCSWRTMYRILNERAPVKDPGTTEEPVTTRSGTVRAGSTYLRV